MKKRIISIVLCAVMCLTCFTQVSVSAATDLPSSWGNTNKEVEDQMPWGTCWAFSGIAALEHHILHVEGKDVNLSEEHLMQMMSYGNASTEWNVKNKNDGGDVSVVPGYYLAGYGPALESEFPYDKVNDLSGTVSAAVKNYKPTYRVNETRNIKRRVNKDRTLTDACITEIKTAVKEYGNVLTIISPYADGGSYEAVHGAYYRSHIDEDLGHGVCIVGWDDDYPAENFGTEDVAENGAFLTRNSWGKDNGDNGYLWVSYDSKDIIPIYSIVGYDEVEPTDNYYSLESIGTAGSSSINVPEDGECGFINVFTLKNTAEIMDEVIFYIPDDVTEFDVTYKVYYMPVDSNGEPAVASKKLIAGGIVKQGGYHKVDIDSDMIISKKAAILVTVCDADDYACIGYERKVAEYTPSYQSKTSYAYKKENGSIGLWEKDANYTIKLKTHTVDAVEAPSIPKVDATEFTVSAISDKTYTGQAIKPTVSVKYGSKTLVSGTDYTITYKNNTYCGKATYTITGEGNYTGTKTGAFYIKPTKTTVTSVAGSKKAFTVKMKNSSKKPSGYQVAYKKSGGSYKYKTTTASKLKVSKLTAKKYYYVKVRAYKTVDGKKIYGSWSASKKVKTK